MGYVRIMEKANWFSLTEPIGPVSKSPKVNVIGYTRALDITMQKSGDPLKTIHKAHSGTHFNLNQKWNTIGTRYLNSTAFI